MRKSTLQIIAMLLVALPGAGCRQGETAQVMRHPVGTGGTNGGKPGGDTGTSRAGLGIEGRALASAAPHALSDNGAVCAADIECVSVHCADGVCCDTACTGPCNACTVALGATADGTCSNTHTGGIPSCVGYQCDGTGPSCPTTCSSDVNCSGGNWCKGGVCVPSIVGSEHATDSGTSGQTSVAVGSSGNTYLLAWTDNRNDAGDVYAMRIDADTGNPIDTPFPVATGSGAQAASAVAGRPGQLLVVWLEGAMHRCARVDATTGTVLDPAGISLPSPGALNYAADAASDGTNYLVVWENLYSITGYEDVLGARVSGDGSLLDTSALPIVTYAQAQMAPAVVFASGSYMVVWGDFSNNVSERMNGRMVNPSTGSFGVITDLGSINAWYHSKLSIATDDGSAAYAAYDTSTVQDKDVAITRFAMPAMDQLAAIRVSNGPRNQHRPSIVATGGAYFVTWDDQRNANDDIYGARIRNDGTVIDVGGLPIATSASSETGNRLAHAANGTALVGYLQAGVPSRVKYRLIGLPRGNTCTADTDCASTRCVEGVCCNSACNGGGCEACSVAGGAPTNGTCSGLTGKVCNDGDACTKNDQCTGRVCGGTSYTCAAPDQCHQAGACSGDGTCSYPNKTDGTPCNDGNACTNSDICTAGVCGGTTYACAAPDQCHQAGTCNGDGTCSFAIKTDGTACNDGSACTQDDVCTAGICGGTTYACAAPDQCHQAGTCNGDGTCSFAIKTDGTACNDGSACTQDDVCTAGVCGGTTYACAAPDQCHQAGTCNGDGTCSFAIKANGTSCSDGKDCTTGDTCQAGVCSSAVNNCQCNTDADCLPLDQCHTAGSCNQATKMCSNPSAANGTHCDDGNACTKGDVCTSGVCAGAGFTCAAPDPCHQAGTCNGDGTCSFANQPDGTACDDGNACTKNDECTAGTCGGTASGCAALDPGPEPGTEPGLEPGLEAGPEPRPEAGPEPRPEAGPGASPEVGLGASPEEGPEMPPEVGSEAGAEAGAEPAPELPRDSALAADVDFSPDTAAIDTPIASPAAPDAGIFSMDASVDVSGKPATKTGSSGCGCMIGEGSRGEILGWPMVLLGLLAFWRCRRRVQTAIRMRSDS
jgi:MYXO-CTERM domain-containing protein